MPEGEVYPIVKKKNPLHWPKPRVGSLSLITAIAVQTFDHLTRLAKNPLLLARSL